MEIPVIYIFTHDSIGVGEDGPTHQPVEQLASLRAIPGLITMRPGDANEVAEAWRVILQFRHEPVALILTRQALPTLDRTKYAPAAGVAKGAYVLADAPGGKPDVLLLATGSEVSLCVAAHEQLVKEGVKSRVVSMPSWELFEHQPQEYKDAVLPPSVTARVSVEQASTFGWERYVGSTGQNIGMQTFGASAPLKELQKKFGFEPENVVAAAKANRRRLRPRRLRPQAGGRGGAAQAGLRGRGRRHELDRPRRLSGLGGGGGQRRARGQGRARRAHLRQRRGRLGGGQQAAGHPRRHLPRHLLRHQGVEHDDMNVLVLGGRVIGPALAHELVQAFVAARYTAEERHARRCEGKAWRRERVTGKEKAMDQRTSRPSAVANPVASLRQYGQSVWLDFIRRSLIAGGELKRLVDEDGLGGVTSNPAIFEKAIGGSNDYKAAIEEISKDPGLGPKEVYERLAIKDIQDAADVLRPVYDRTRPATAT